MTIKVSNAAAIAAVNALTALLAVGGDGHLKIYSGSVPADADASLGAAVLLSDHTMNTTDEFPDATDANPGATTSANAITNVNASASGTASFFRLTNAAGTAVLQGSVGTSGADMIVSTVTFVSGQPVQITSVTITHPE
jgi:hypothetical protein